MEEELLKVFYEELVNVLNLNYEYMELTGDLIYPYITGEHSINNYIFEDNHIEGEMLLEVWNRGKELDLIQVCEKIQEHFKKFSKVSNNIGLCITFRNKFPVRTGVMDLKKIQIHLDTNVWKGE